MTVHLWISNYEYGATYGLTPVRYRRLCGAEDGWANRDVKKCTCDVCILLNMAQQAEKHDDASA